MIDGTNFAAHRLAWLYTHGVWPEHWIDHRNRVRHDNRISNLRDVDMAHNRHNVGTKPNRNNKTGLLGVVRSANGKRFSSRISYPGKKNLYLGTFDTPEAAHAAFMAAKMKYQPGAL